MSELKAGDKITENGTEWTVTAIIKDTNGNVQAVEKVGHIAIGADIGNSLSEEPNRDN
jgi:sorbitol-specific phosphotransferase system component IIA